MLQIEQPYLIVPRDHYKNYSGKYSTNIAENILACPC